MRNDGLQELITRFFVTYLPLQKGYSTNTIKSYATAFMLLFVFLEENKGCKPCDITFNTLTGGSISEFCSWIETSRKCKPKTRNLRLEAIQSFFHFVSIYHPELALKCKEIQGVPLKKVEKVIPPHLCSDELDMLFKQPDTRKKQGVRDLALLQLLFETAIRVSELVNICVGDIDWKGIPVLTVMAKGARMHSIGIPDDTMNLLGIYARVFKIDVNNSEEVLFKNPSGRKLTRQGVNHILKKYEKKAKDMNPGYFKKLVSAHAIRHSKAYELVHDEVDLIYIRDLLGHSSVVTTELYARTSTELVRKAIVANDRHCFEEQSNVYQEKEREDLMVFLKGLR